MKKSNRFTFCTAELKEAKAVMLGCLFDETASGANNAPDALRYLSREASDYHITTDRSLTDLKIRDCGNIFLDKKNGKDQKELYEAAFAHFDQGRFLFALGEDRSITYTILKSAFSKFPQLKVLVIDAHHGMESVEEPFGEMNYLSHAIRDFLPMENLYKMGIREGSKESYNSGIRRHKHLPPRVKKGVLERLPKLYHSPLYLSIDMDVFDPAYAPGARHLSSGGINPFEMLDTINLLQSVPVIGVDLVGYDAKKDVSNVTATLAYKMMKESLIYFL